MGEGWSAVQPGEPDPDRSQDPAARPERPERELLWVESVSERLLGVQEPRPWERVYFDPDAAHSDAGQTADDPVGASGETESAEPAETIEAENIEQVEEPLDHPMAHDEHAITPGEDPSVTIPTTTAEGYPPSASLTDSPPAPRVVDLTGADSAARSFGPTDDDILHAALVSGNAGLAGAVVELLDSRARDQARIASLERALRVLLVEVGRSADGGGSQSGSSITAVLQRVLGS
jgi:hypothetical protein